MAVDGAEGIIEEVERGVEVEATRNVDTLLLASGQVDSFLADLGGRQLCGTCTFTWLGKLYSPP